MSNKRVRKWVNLALSLTVGGGLIFGLSNSVGPLPALAKAFHPVTGAWTSAQTDQLRPHSQDIRIPGTEQEVRILFEQDGTAHIQAETNRDAWLAVGYLHGKFRLFQMDLMRRQGAGLLSEIIGPGALEADLLQRQLGISRTAEAEWAMVQDNPETKSVLEAYAQGVNAVISEQTADHTLPMMFKIMGYEPQPWTPQDTLVMKGVLAQMMSLNSASLVNQMYVNWFGQDVADDLIPVKHPANQAPYAVGPYKKLPPDSLPISGEHYFMTNRQSASAVPPQPATAPAPETASLFETGLQQTSSAAALSILQTFDSLPFFAGVTDRNENSNAWVVSGAKTASGKPLLAGDPHLTQTLPSTWYQIQVEAPGYDFAGATVPGIPFPLVGYNEDISWTMTNGASQQTFFYQEKMDEAHPNQYFWNGKWHDLTIRKETIPVKGGGEQVVEIKSTVHGPIVDKNGFTVALNWLGSIPYNALDSLHQVMVADDYNDFRGAFENWGAPAMNFTYADQKGNIGIIAAGTYPIFKEGTQPQLTLRGTGEDDFIGRIPFEAIPQAYNPKSGFLGTANQRQVGDDYPYYVGSSAMYSAPYRAQRIHDLLSENKKFTAEDMQKMQADVHDIMAEQITPLLIHALESAGNLNETETAALNQLKSWDYQMKADSSGALIWNMFWERYIDATFLPWWDKYEIPYKEEAYQNLAPNPEYQPLMQNLLLWTINDPGNKYFSNPITGETRNAAQVMELAFREAITKLSEQAGDDVAKWQYGNLHKRFIPSMAQIPALGYDERSAGGSPATLNVAYKWKSNIGATWRMVTDWGTGQSVGVYPGGQSENPISPWYTDRMDTWWDVTYNPMLNYEQAGQTEGVVLWRILPE